MLHSLPTDLRILKNWGSQSYEEVSHTHQTALLLDVTTAPGRGKVAPCSCFQIGSFFECLNRADVWEESYTYSYCISGINLVLHTKQCQRREVSKDSTQFHTQSPNCIILSQFYHPSAILYDLHFYNRQLIRAKYTTVTEHLRMMHCFCASECYKWQIYLNQARLCLPFFGVTYFRLLHWNLKNYFMK